jgi:hypothetical protein
MLAETKKVTFWSVTTKEGTFFREDFEETGGVITTETQKIFLTGFSETGKPKIKIEKNE